MFRIVLLMLFYSLYHVFLVTMAVVLGVETLPLTVVPLALAFSVFFQGPIEGLSTLLLLGIVVDAFSGMPIGINVAVALLLWFACASAASWFGKPRWLVVLVFIVMTSLLYRILVCGMLYFLSGNAGNFEWIPLLWAPFADGLIGIYFIRLLHSLLSKFKLVESMDGLSVRLSSRKAQGNAR